MNSFDYDYIIPTYGDDLVRGVVRGLAERQFGRRGVRWTITSDDDFITVSFTSQKAMQTFGMLWRELSGEPEMEKGA